MKKHALLITTCMAWALHAPVSPSFAAEQAAAPTSEMDRLMAAGQYQQAFELGGDSLEEWEGDPNFDFLYGLAGLESGNPNDAVFALERVAAVSTDGVLRERARLELARAYFVTNNLTASENLFNAVLANNPPANVRQNIEAFLQLIETRRNTQSPSFAFTVATSIGSDSNINSATSNSLVDTPLVGQIELDESGQQLDDTFSNTTLSASYVYPFTRNQSLTGNLSLNHLDNFDTDQFDIDNLRGSLTYGWGNEVDRFRHGATASTVRLDSVGFQDSVGLNSSWQRNWGNGLYSTVSGAYNLIRFDDGSNPTNSLRDVDQFLVTAGGTLIRGLFTHSLNVYRANESAENLNGGSHNGRGYTGLAYSLLYRLNAQHTPYLRATMQDVEHDDNHPVFFDRVRNDDTESITLGWFWQLQRNLVITGEAAYTENSSNIPLFDFSRFRFQIGARYNF